MDQLDLGYGFRASQLPEQILRTQNPPRSRLSRGNPPQSGSSSSIRKGIRRRRWQVAP
jgi:hypothetical protein